MNVAADIVADLAAYQNKAKPRLARTLLDAIPGLRRNETRPLVNTGLALVDQHAPLMTGQLVALFGAPGAGKTTFLMQWLAHHAKTLGPALAISLEMSLEELAARRLSQRLGMSWLTTLRGGVPDELAAVELDLPRLRVLDGADATLANARAEIVALREEFPGQPIMVAVDYLQIMPSLDDGQRSEAQRIAAVVEQIRALARSEDVLIVMLSQTSRAAARSLRDGELVGAATASVGAESSQIERAAFVTLALGEEVEKDGERVVMLSIGKVRMGSSRIIPLKFDGAAGTFTEAGQALTAAELRGERAAEKDGAHVTAATHAIFAELAKAAAPMSQRALRELLGARTAIVGAAVKALIEEDPPRVVRVKPGKRGAWPLWTADNARTAGLDVVPTGVE